MSRSYARIAQQIVDSNWLITESGLALIMEIFERRMSGDNLSDEQIATMLQSVDGHGSESEKPYSVNSGIATLGIYGPIFGKANLMTQLSGATSLESFRKDFAQALADDSVKSVLLDIDSPGGTSEMVAEAGDDIYAARDVKPIYAIANNEVGSAAFWLATQAEKFYTTPSGVVGSVGAYTVHQDQSVRDAQQGVKYTFISAGKYKTEGNQHEPLSRDAIDYRQEVIDELYTDFVNVVARGRGVSTDKVEASYGQGRMLPAKKAVIAGMVDGVREYDSLVQSISESHPQQVSFSVGGKSYAAKLLGGKLFLLDGTELDAQLSNADMEHSDPGTGNPPQPRVREDNDKAIESGSRRGDLTDPFPENPNDPGAPRAMADENDVVNELCALLGITMGTDNSANAESVVARVTEMKSTTDALKTSVDHAKTFAEQFPDEYARMERQEKRIREGDADAFVSSISRFTKQVGETVEPTKFGLSSLAKEGIKESYIKIATGMYGLSDFESMIKAITSGFVDFGNTGSTRAAEIDDVNLNLDVSTPEEAMNLRNAFAKHVNEIMQSDKLDWNTAVAEASKRYPDLAAAYVNAIPVK